MEQSPSLDFSLSAYRKSRKCALIQQSCNDQLDSGFWSILSCYNTAQYRQARSNLSKTSMLNPIARHRCGGAIKMAFENIVPKRWRKDNLRSK